MWVSAETAGEIAQLKRQVAIKQKQIDQLLQAVNRLQAEIAPSPKAATAPAAEPTGNNQVASLVPILPPEPKAQPSGANCGLAIDAPLSLPRAIGFKKPDTPGLQSATLPRSAVASSESLLAGQERGPGPLIFDHGKFRIGTTFFGLYRYYAKTGFAPQTLPEINNPGPDNGGFNSFDMDRTFINLFFSPNDALTFRVTPNIYRQYAGASAVSLSKNAAVSSSVNGNFVFRLRYAYVDFNKLFAHSKAFGNDVVTFGQQQNPLVEWENNLYGYRFVNSVPWNYLSLSTFYAGLRLHGPIEMHGKQYLDYDVGVFNNSSFHAYETGDRKQVMARLSYYSLGAVSQYQGLGLTGFVDYGYRDAAPDLNINVPITRLAALAHCTTRSNDYGIAGGFDSGSNAFTVNNLFSGSGPADAFGLGPTPYATFSSIAEALLGGNHTRQRGFDFFGHARIAKSPFYLFGTFMQFNPNTLVSRNPLDFRTVIGGVSYN